MGLLDKSTQRDVRKINHDHQNDLEEEVSSQIVNLRCLDSVL